MLEIIQAVHETFEGSGNSYLVDYCINWMQVEYVNRYTGDKIDIIGVKEFTTLNMKSGSQIVCCLEFNYCVKRLEHCVLKKDSFNYLWEN